MTPKYSPWGHIQQIKELSTDIYWVDTAGHGGLMIHENQIDNFGVLSEIVLENIIISGGWYCFEEDCMWAFALYHNPALLDMFCWIMNYPMAEAKEAMKKTIKMFFGFTFDQKFDRYRQIRQKLNLYSDCN